MIKIYTDAAFNLEHKLACYCLVIVNEKTNVKTWEIHRADSVNTSDQAERAGVWHAIRIAKAYKSNGEDSAVYCDNTSALANYRATAERLSIELYHIKAHQLYVRDRRHPAGSRPHIKVTEDMKRQHWADTQAYNYLKNVLDLLSTSEDDRGMETTKHDN